MKENILDEIDLNTSDNKAPIIKLIIIAIGVILLFLLLEKLWPLLPEALYERDGVQIKTVGLIFIGIVLILTITITDILNKIEPKLKVFQVVVITGLILFVIEFLFKVIQNVFLFANGLNLEYFDIFKIAISLAIIGMLIANIRIHRIRKKKTLIPVLLLIGIWGLFAFMMKA